MPVCARLLLSKVPHSSSIAVRCKLADVRLSAGCSWGRSVAKRRRFEVRLTDEQLATLKQTAETRGFRSASAYVQNLLRNDATDRKNDETDREAVIAASME